MTTTYRLESTGGFFPHLGELFDQNIHGFGKPAPGAFDLATHERSCPLKVCHVRNPPVNLLGTAG
jgi:hypothetical protein